MVYALLVHSLDTDTCDVLVSFFFTPEGNDGHRKRRECAIADMVCHDYAFRRQCDAFADGLPSSERALEETVSQQPSSNDAEEYMGVFTLPPSPFVAEAMTILWKRCGTVGYSLVLEQHENRLLAINFLTIFENTLREHFKVAKTIAAWDHADVKSRPEEVAALVNHHIPSGRLLFATPALAAHFRKETADTLLSSQK